MIHLVILAGLAQAVGAMRTEAVVSESCSSPSFKDNIEYSWAPDPTGRAANMMLRKKRIFDYASEEVNCHKLNRANEETISEENLESSCSKLSAALGVKAESAGMFSASISASTDISSSSNVRKVRVDTFMRAMMAGASVDQDWVSHLTKHAKHTMMTATPAEIIEAYGAFFATEIRFGALIRLTMTKESSASDSKFSMEAALKAETPALLGSMGASAEASFSKSDEESKSAAKIEMTIASEGGDPMIWFGHEADDEESMKAVKKEWKTSVTSDNAMPVHFTMVPLWRVVEKLDPEKGHALQLEIQRLWQTDMEKLQINDLYPKRTTTTIAPRALHVPGEKNTVINIHSVNRGDHMLRHYGSVFHLAKEEGGTDFLRDGAFIVREGLWGHGTVSFESFNYKKHFLRHSGEWCKIDNIDSDQDKKDASFYIADPLDDSGCDSGSVCKSFKAVSFADFKDNYWLRHSSWRLRIDDPAHLSWFPRDETFKRDGTWKISFARMENNETKLPREHDEDLIWEP
mmetsp:Transcript_105255/g.234889  ORF Transcript_105255/g.234889 Transcript_105255/m.234889 type:complete len:518 (-) Transcript_105255:131-1684(-)